MIPPVPNYHPVALAEQLRTANGQPLHLERGLLVFADVSGFTSLTERFARCGLPVAGEALQTLMSNYFDLLLGELLTDGGEVVKFAGDALLVLYSAADFRPRSVLAAALAAAAMTFQASSQAQYLFGMGLPATLVDGLQLRCKVAICGPGVDALLVGGEYDRREIVLAGPALRQLAAISDDNQVACVTVSAEFHALLAAAEADEGGAKWESLPSGAFRCQASVAIAGQKKAGDAVPQTAAFAPAAPSTMAASPIADPAVQRWLWGLSMETIAIRAQAGLPIAKLADLRQCSVIFASLNDLPDPSRSADVMAVMAPAVRQFQRTLRRHGGCLRQAIVDDKGAVMIGMFGAPHTSTGRDAVEAVSAALMLSETIANLSIGVSSGRAFFGTVGPARRCEYSAMGDTVNTAARLMVAAHKKRVSGPLLDAATAAALEQMQDDSAPVACTPFEVLALKGKSSGLQTFTVHRRQQQQLRTRSQRASVEHAEEHGATAFVGRSAELALLSSARVAILSGEAGIGKSTLFDEVVSRRSADDSSLRVIAAAGLISTRVIPFFLVGQLLASLAALGDAAELQRGRWAGSDLQPRDAAVVGLLVDVPALSETSADVKSALTAEVIQAVARYAGADRTFALRRLVTSLLCLSGSRRVPERHLLVGIEDLHWADEDSCAAMAAMLSAVTRQPQLYGPHLILLTTRPLASEPSAAASVRDILQHGMVVSLPLLTAAESRQLLLRQFHLKDVSERLMEQLQTASRGHPLFLSQCVALLLQRGDAEVATDGMLSAAAVEGGKLPIPDSVERMALSRLDCLNVVDAETLRASSIVGDRPFQSKDVALVLDAATANDGNTEAAIGNLEKASLLTVVDVSQVEFVHQMLRDAIYGSLGVAQRRLWHAVYAAHLEQDYEHRGAEDIAGLVWLGHHRASAGQSAQAAAAFLTAARRQRGSLAELLPLLERTVALDAECSNSDRIYARYLLCRGLHLIGGRLAEATRVADEGLALSGFKSSQVADLEVAGNEALNWLVNGVTLPLEAHVAPEGPARTEQVAIGALFLTSLRQRMATEPYHPHTASVLLDALFRAADWIHFGNILALFLTNGRAQLQSLEPFLKTVLAAETHPQSTDEGRTMARWVRVMLAFYRHAIYGHESGGKTAIQIAKEASAQAMSNGDLESYEDVISTTLPMLLMAGEFDAAHKQCLLLADSAERSKRLLHCAIAHRSDLLCATMAGDHERAVRDCYPRYLQLAPRDIGGGAMMLPLTRAIYAMASVRLWQRGDRSDPQRLRQSSALMVDVLKAIDKVTVVFMRRAFFLTAYLDATLMLFADVAFVASQVPATRAWLQSDLHAAAPKAIAIAGRLLEAYPPDRRTGTPAAHFWAGLLPLALAESAGEKLADEAIAAARQQLETALTEAQLRLHRPMEAQALAALATLAAHAGDRSAADSYGQRARAVGIPLPFWTWGL